MHIRTCIAITALAMPIFLAACASEAPPDSDPAAPPQQELARDIRTIITGEKSPVQQEALVQAGKITPGQMSDALREVLVDATAFITYLDDRYETDDPRLDSLNLLLVHALQPHFSETEIAAAILSIANRSDSVHVRFATQQAAAYLAMHIPPGEMGESLRHAVIEGVAGISRENYGMYTTRKILFETLINQIPGGMEALASNPEEAIGPDILDARRMSYLKSIVREESMIRTQAPYIPSPVPNPEIVPLDSLVSAIQAISEGKKGNRQQEAARHVRRIAETDPAQIGDTLRVAMIRAFRYLHIEAQQKEETVWEKRYSPLRYPLGAALDQLKDPDIGEMFVEMEAYGTCGSGHQLIFRQFPDQSAPLLTEAISRSTTRPEKMFDGLHVLTNMIAGYKLGRLNLSQESRALLIATSRHFLDGDLLPSLPISEGADSYNRETILYPALLFAVTLDEPELIDIVQELATNPDKIIALGIPDERVKYVQEDARRLLSRRPYMGGGDC